VVLRGPQPLEKEAQRGRAQQELSGQSWPTGADPGRRAARQSFPDRIVLADRVVYLRNGPCPYAVGTALEVEYSERDGRRTVEKITPTGVAL